MESIVAIGLFLLGGLVTGLISYGWHKREHKVLSDDNAAMKRQLEQHDGRLDNMDVLLASVTTTLDYIVKKVDNIDEKLDRPRNG